MDDDSVDALAWRLEVLKRENRRWRCVASVAALGLVLSLALGGLLGSRVIVAQERQEKAGKPAPLRMEYKVSETMYLHQIEKPLQDMSAEGWELVQILPTEYTTTGQGAAGRFERGIAVVRRPTVPVK